MAKQKIGISCAGGGIKAFSQIGVMRYLHALDIHGAAFSGTSMGSIVAAFLAADVPIDDIETALLDIEKAVVEEKLFKFTNAQVFPLIKSDASGLISPEPFIEILKTQLAKYGIHDFKDLKHPLIVAAVDLNSGQTVLFTNLQDFEYPEHIVIKDASLLEALQASASFPMVFDTMMFRDFQLVDGGITMNAPVMPLVTAGYYPVLSITMSIQSDYQTSTHLRDIANRVIEIVLNEGDLRAIKHAELNINAYDRNIGIFSFDKGKAAIDLGYEMAKQHHQDLLEFKKLTQPSWLDRFR